MTKNQKTYSDAKLKNLEKSLVEIIGTIATETWEQHRIEAIKNINESVSIDGFRKGMVPENILIAKVGEMAILEEMAELALTPAYMDIMIDNKIDAIGRPNIQITKLAKDNPLEFKIITAVAPTVTLPDYKKISSDIINQENPKDAEATEKDIADTIDKIRRSKNENHGHIHNHDDKEDPDHLHSKEEKTAGKNTNSEPLPELTDEEVRKYGDFANRDEFKNKVKEIISAQKADQAVEKRRIKIADSLSDSTNIDMPEIMIESETNRIQAQFTDDIERMGVKLDDYLKHSKKTIDDIRKEWRPHAEKKVKLQLILNAIATKENIHPQKEEIENEVKHILEHYKDADREQVYTYAETVLTNEKVFQFLESNK